jgi:hypothetical protein
MIHRYGRDFPRFCNLRTLILDQCDEVHMLLEYFILFAPNLEKLTLQNCTVRDFYYPCILLYNIVFLLVYCDWN